MMVTVHGLPNNTINHHLRKLLKEPCNINHYSLGKMIPDIPGLKKVNIGLSNDQDVQQLIKSLDGYRFAGHVLKVVPVPKSSETQEQNHGNYREPRNINPHGNYGQVMPYQLRRPLNFKEWLHPQAYGDQTYYFQNQAYLSYLYQFRLQSFQARRRSKRRTRRRRPAAAGSAMPTEQDQKDPQKSQPEHDMHQPSVPEVKSQELRADEMVNSRQNSDPTQNRIPSSEQECAATEESVISPSGRNTSEARISPSGRERWSSERNISSYSARIASPGRNISPTGAELSPLEPILSPDMSIISSEFSLSPEHEISLDRNISPSYTISSGRKISLSIRRFSPPGRWVSPSGRRTSPSARDLSSRVCRISPYQSMPEFERIMSPEREFSSFRGRISPYGRRKSPSTRNWSPHGRRISPYQSIPEFERIMSPEREFSSFRCRISPYQRTSPSARKMSPPGRQISPYQSMPPTFERITSPEREISPLGREMSPPHRKMTPQRTIMLPGERNKALTPEESPRRMSPPRKRSRESRVRQPRYSPDRRTNKSEDKYDAPAFKSLSRIYNVELTQNQSAHSSGSDPYPIAKARQLNTDRKSRGQQEPTFTGTSKQDDNDSSKVKFDRVRVVPARAIGEREQQEEKRPDRRTRSLRRSRSRSRSAGREHCSRRSRPPRAIGERKQQEEKRPDRRTRSLRRSRSRSRSAGRERCSRRSRPPRAIGEREQQEEKRPDKRIRSLRRSRSRSRSAGREHCSRRSRPPRAIGERKQQEEKRPDRRTRSLRRSRSRSRSAGRERCSRRSRPPRAIGEREQQEEKRPDKRIRSLRCSRSRSRSAGRERCSRRAHSPPPQRIPWDLEKRSSPAPPAAHVRDRTRHDNNESYRDDARLSQYQKDFKREKTHESEELHECESRRSRNVEPPERDIEDRSRLERGKEYGRQDFYLSKTLNKAVVEITDNILSKNSLTTDSTVAVSIIEALKEMIATLLSDMFGSNDVSFIDVILKFNEKYGENELKEIFDVIVSRLSGSCETLKRSAPGCGMKEEAIMDVNMQFPEYALYDRQSEGVGFDSHHGEVDPTSSMLSAPTYVQMFKEKDDLLMALANTHGVSYRDWPDLVSTEEELWYERASIWLPGHSKCRNIEPLDKLKMQNSMLQNVHIDRWKLVKKILTTKGTRLYVDMPPSAARALEKHKMMLSYELQKVNVFLKTVAVDTDAFDNGLKESSLPEQSSLITAAAQNSPMPLLSKEELNIVKISIKNYKVRNVSVARNIKEKIILSIYKYYQNGGSSETSFVKYGWCQQGAYFGVIPENEKSKRWLSDLNLGKLNKQPIFVLNNKIDSKLYIKMYMMIPKPSIQLTSTMILKRLKIKKRGLSLNFKKWKPLSITAHNGHTSKFDVNIDLDSIKTLMQIGFKIYYSDSSTRDYMIKVISPYSIEHLDHILSEREAELTDKYDVANMNLVSSDGDDNDVVFVSEKFIS